MKRKQIYFDTDPDMRIIHAILANPLTTRQKLADDTGLSESTVQRRLTSLKDAGELEDHLALATSNRFFPIRSMINFDVETEKLVGADYGYRNQQEFVCFLMWGLVEQQKFSKVMANVIIERVECVLGGPTDLILFISGVDAQAIAEFLTTILRTLPGVKNTNTATLVSFPKSLWDSRKAVQKNKPNKSNTK